MEKTNVELLYEWLDKATDVIQQHHEEPYLDSLIFTMEALFHQSVPEGMDDILAHKLQSTLKDIEISTFKIEEIRKGIQLTILKGMKDTTQQQHLMTPETVALLVGYLAEKVTSDKEQLRLFDPVSGTANLITTVLSQLKQQVEAFAGEVDPTLIQLAAINANLQQKEIEFFHQDSLGPFLLDPVDLVVADLPVGYYPDDIRANDFELKADEGHSYAHHLFIEQSMNYTNAGGYLIFVIPDFLFDSEQSDKLHSFIQEYAHIVGVIRLPESAFKSEKNIKSILILQKKGPDTNAPKQPLLVKMPSFNNTNAMGDILEQMNTWFSTY
ncbi:site-specific DNA-methyltransferase (adenine-specific) [Virgibacillus natechei]|uniref:Site-specific DNA-methyltransferase (Adenine-specific) n=1 Tax=Virgibacillus natechei TaxID=1216297 RepID=A0ABS4ID82_9BACI|nr:class I SAM-dependent methyltransferase [Virgibacillus natechei]MBP1968899.1 site-specific DNA-methyltransferase (adenine-specific) [Virgibacillus natechei]UZD11693.1 class I SAM-dependent methyltransferase [Virgibacillus natechei]